MNPAIARTGNVEHLRVATPLLPDLGWLAPEPIDLGAINPVQNISANKPLGGLWLSPILEGKSGTMWSEWLESEGVGLYDERGQTVVSQKVKIRADARLLMITTWEDFQEVLSAYLLIDPIFEALGSSGSPLNCQFFDFERIAQEWDGIYLTDEGQWATRYAPDRNASIFSTPSLYGWDLESVLIFNARSVEALGDAVSIELKPAY